MTDIVLFHHALGLTPGVQAFSDELRAAGHTVHVPDLYQGRVFADLDEGVAFAQSTGIPVLIGRGAAAVAELPPGVVYAGFSLGASVAQTLVVDKPGALAALLYHGASSPRWFSSAWPAEVPLQIHTTAADPWFEFDECEQLLAVAPRAQMFVYPGSAHLFADPGSGEYDAGSAALLMERTLAFLDGLL